eukprot:1471928-Pyramimonas_sp.AAC.2
MVMWLSRGRSGRGGRSGGRGRYSYVTHRSHGARSALLICHAPLWGQERARGQKRRARACLQHSHAQKLRMHDMVTCAGVNWKIVSTYEPKTMLTNSPA